MFQTREETGKPASCSLLCCKCTMAQLRGISFRRLRVCVGLLVHVVARSLKICATAYGASSVRFGETTLYQH